MTVDDETERVDARLVSLGAAIKVALADRSQTWLANQLGVDNSTVSRIIGGKFPELALERVVQIENVLGLGRGDLLRSGGYVDGDMTVPMAIAADTALDREAKRSLNWAYRAAVSSPAAAQQ